MSINQLSLRSGYLGDHGHIGSIAVSEGGSFFVTAGEKGVNVYETHTGSVIIDGKTYMAENLRTNRYSNGDPIPIKENGDEWSNLKSGAMYYYNNDPSHAGKWGAIYNGYAVDDN